MNEDARILALLRALSEDYGKRSFNEDEVLGNWFQVIGMCRFVGELTGRDYEDTMKLVDRAMEWFIVKLPKSVKGNIVHALSKNCVNVLRKDERERKRRASSN